MDQVEKIVEKNNNKNSISMKEEITKFLLYYIIMLVVLWIVDYSLNNIFNLDKYTIFTIINMCCLLIIDYQNANEIIWFILTYLHGLAHIYSPAFINNIVPNNNYTPLYDYLVHAAQCLCVCLYYNNDNNKNKIYYQLIGVLMMSYMLTAAIISHIDRNFLQSNLWVLLSIGGVFGTHYHMMLINEKNKYKSIYISSLIIWLLPYLGYLFYIFGDSYNFIPYWDYFVNFIGLFKFWYCNFLFAYYCFIHY